MTDLQIHGINLEHRANLLRDRLVRTLDELDRRRHDFTSVKAQARRHPEVTVAAAAALLLVVGGGITIGLVRARSRKARMRQARMEALRRLWWQPERVARRQPGVLARIGRGLLVATGTAGGMWALRRGAAYAVAMARPLPGAGLRPALPAAQTAIVTAEPAVPARIVDVE